MRGLQRLRMRGLQRLRMRGLQRLRMRGLRCRTRGLGRPAMPHPRLGLRRSFRETGKAGSGAEGADAGYKEACHLKAELP